MTAVRTVSNHQSSINNHELLNTISNFYCELITEHFTTSHLDRASWPQERMRREIPGLREETDLVIPFFDFGISQSLSNCSEPTTFPLLLWNDWKNQWAITNEQLTVISFYWSLIIENWTLVLRPLSSVLCRLPSVDLTLSTPFHPKL